MKFLNGLCVESNDAIFNDKVGIGMKFLNGLCVESNDAIFNDKVGIGVTNPSSKLQVDGDLKIGTDTGFGRLVYNDGLHIKAGTSGIGNLGVFVDNSGNVGIGTTGPDSKLHIAGNIKHTGSIICQGANYAVAWMKFDESQNGNSLLLGAGGLTAIGGGESIDQVRGNIETSDERLVLASDVGGTSIAHHFITNLQNGWADGIDAMVIRGDGNVGIGTSSPAYKLDVTGDIRGQNNLYVSGNVGIGTTSPSYKLHVAGGAFIDQGSAEFKFNGDNLSLIYTADTTCYPYIEWRNSAGERGMYLGWGSSGNYIDLCLENGNNLAIQGGNVGIGTKPNLEEPVALPQVLL